MGSTVLSSTDMRDIQLLSRYAVCSKTNTTHSIVDIPYNYKDNLVYPSPAARYSFTLIGRVTHRVKNLTTAQFAFNVPKFESPAWPRILTLFQISNAYITPNPMCSTSKILSGFNQSSQRWLILTKISCHRYVFFFINKPVYDEIYLANLVNLISLCKYTLNCYVLVSEEITNQSSNGFCNKCSTSDRWEQYRSIPTQYKQYFKFFLRIAKSDQKQPNPMCLLYIYAIKLPCLMFDVKEYPGVVLLCISHILKKSYLVTWLARVTSISIKLIY